MTKSADLQRLASLSDCVFAVAMTLLAFSVRIPDPSITEAKLPGELTRMFNESSGLVLSFASAGMFWIGHFRLLHSLRHATVGLIYLNLLQLFWIVLLPISTSLWIRIETKETTMVAGANLTLIALCGVLMWVYAHRAGLFEPGAFTHSVVVELIGPVFPLLVFAISLVVIFWNPALGHKLWWSAFATPFLILFARTAVPAAKIPTPAPRSAEDKNVRG
jgi:TMEM175 potassium channel family protein